MDNNHGHIVAISSAAAFSTLPMISAYNATKSAVWNLCSSLRAELTIAQKPGVSVTCICPGPIKTKMVDEQENTILAPSKSGLQILDISYAVKIMFDAIAEKKELLIFPAQIYIISSLTL